MVRKAKQVKNLRNTQEPKSGKQKGQRPTGPFHSSWADSEIIAFLLMWGVVEQEVGFPGKKIHKKARVLCQRLCQWGLKKSWTSCFHLLLSLQNLCRILCSEGLEIKLLQAMYVILGYCLQRSSYPGPNCNGAGNPLLPKDPQPSIELFCSMSWDYATPVPSGELQENPSQMMSKENSPFPTWEPWSPNYPLTVSRLLPSLVSGDTSPQQPQSTSDVNPGPQ